MKHSTVRKLTRAAIVSFLALTTVSGAAAVAVMTASPALSQPDGLGGSSAPGLGSDSADPAPTPVPTPTPPLPIPAVP